MPRPNTSFELSVSDIARIEDALLIQSRSLSHERLARSSNDPADLAGVSAVAAELHAVQDLLGRLHAQKEFYRPRVGYVGG